MQPLDRLHAAKLILSGDLEAARAYGAMRRNQPGNAETLARIESRWAAAGVSESSRDLVEMLCGGTMPDRIGRHLDGAPCGRSRTDIGMVQHALGTIAEALRIAKAA